MTIAKKIAFATWMAVIGLSAIVASAQPITVYEGDFPPQKYPIISTAEIIEAAYNKTKAKQVHSDFINNPRRPTLLLNSPLLEIEELRPLVEKRAFKAEWSFDLSIKENCFRLTMVGLIPITATKAEVDTIRANLAAKYGTTKNGAVYASWFTGKLERLEMPIETIMGRAGKSVYISDYYVDGVMGILTDAAGGYMPNYWGAMEFCQIVDPEGLRIYRHDGKWYENFYDMACLEHHINERYRPDIDTLESMLWLLTTDSLGQSHLTPLRPEKNSRKLRPVLTQIEQIVEQLPLMSFGFLLTEDQRLYSGRFIEAAYSKNSGWRLTETLKPKL